MKSIEALSYVGQKHAQPARWVALTDTKQTQEAAFVASFTAALTRSSNKNVGSNVLTQCPSEKRTYFMNAKHLTTYMKDHFAGSVAAVELLDHLISSTRGKTHEKFFIQLRQEVGEDQEVLRGLLHDLDAASGALRDTTAFLSEKLARIKLKLEDPSDGQLARLEKLETLALGIDGKRALWQALLAIAEEIPALRKVDLARLDKRAEDQRNRVEELRVEAARGAFLPAKS